MRPGIAYEFQSAIFEADDRSRHRPTILLLHGVSSRETVFWYPRRQCLGGFLSRNFYVLTGRLRFGRANSDFDKQWDFDTYLNEDLPQIWNEACTLAAVNTRDASSEHERALAASADSDSATIATIAATPTAMTANANVTTANANNNAIAVTTATTATACPADRPIVLGYSMGGMLALLAQARGLISAPALVIMASPFWFPNIPFYPELMRRVYYVASKLGLPRIPTRFLGHLAIWYFARGCPSKNDADLRLFHALIRGSGVDIPPALLKQLINWVDTGRLCDRSGQYDYTSELASVTAPTLFIAGENDRIAPPLVVRRAFESVSSSTKEIAVIRRGNHLNLVNGPTAAEVATIVYCWIQKALPNVMKN